MTVLPPIPRTQDPREIDNWFTEIKRNIDTAFNAIGSLFWDAIDKTGSSLADIETRTHESLQSIDSGTYRHLSAAQKTGLTGGGETSLHSHADSTTVTNHIAATAAHGATGAVVGTTNTQTLTNKTLSDLKLGRTATSTTPYAVLTTDLIVEFDTSGGAKTADLPAVATAGAGKTYIIKDGSGNGAANNITIDGSGAETIDGAATLVIASNYGVARLYCTGTKWLTC